MIQANNSERWSLFGWQGLAFEVPPEWSPAAVYGTRRSGYACLDDENALRLEVRWERARRRVNWDKTFKQYAKKLAGKLHLKRGAFKPDVLRLPPMAPYEVNGLGWRGIDARHALAGIRCPECERLVLLQVTGRANQNGEKLLKRMIATFSDHRSDKSDLWSFFDMRAQWPASFELTASRFTAGLIELKLRHGRAALELRRLALGSRTLGGKDLYQWAVGFMGKKARRRRWSAEKIACGSHEGILLADASAGWNPFNRKRRTAVCWLCDDSDRLFFVTLAGGRDPAGRIGELIGGIACHTDGEHAAPKEKTQQGREPAGAGSA